MQLVAHEHNRRDIARRINAARHRHPHVRRRERRGVIDAIPDHRDAPPLAPQLLNQRRLAGRLHAGVNFAVRDADRGRDRERGLAAVTRQHDGAQALGAQLGDC